MGCLCFKETKWNTKQKKGISKIASDTNNNTNEEKIEETLKVSKENKIQKKDISRMASLINTIHIKKKRTTKKKP